MQRIRLAKPSTAKTRVQSPELIRYSTYLTRHEERKVKMLEHLQEARLEKEGGSR
jgi:hypothetical protein